MRTDFEKKDIDASHYRFAVVVSRWHDELTNSLSDGAQRALREAGVADESIDIFQVPGAFELPAAAQRAAQTKFYNSVIALGVVIRGDTPHFEFVAGQAAAGITQASLSTGVPVMFGVVTTDTLQQAIDRCGDGNDNKGYEAAVSAIEMAAVFESIGSREQELLEDFKTRVLSTIA